MKNPAKPAPGEILSILSLFALIGIGMGLISGMRTALQNAYLSRGMSEIFFWILARSINHHLGIFLAVAALDIMIFSTLKVLGSSSRGAVHLAVIPVSVVTILYIYGRPFWTVFRSNPGRLIGKTDAMIYLAGMVLLVLFVPLWHFWLGKAGRDFWTGTFLRALAHRATAIVAVILVAGTNGLDLIDWSGSRMPASNLIVISIDTLRADHLGCYGYGGENSASIDAFASEGIQFMKAISQSSWTLPSHASLFTGDYPSAHGAVNKRRSIPPSFLMLAEILRNAGYSTAAFTGGGFLNSVYGFGQGFEEYGHCIALDSDDTWRFIDDQGGKPFFLFLHTYAVHNYFVPPELMDRLGGEYRDDFPDQASIMAFVDRHRLEDLDERSIPLMEHLRDRYDLSIQFIDRQFGSLMSGLERRGLLERTMIVFLSDHGEEFGEHGRTYHGGTLFNEQVHVPLLLRLPGNERGERKIGDVVELIDILPTILDVLDIRLPAEIDGESLLPLIEGEKKQGNGIAFSEISSEITEKYSVCDSTEKLIFSPRREDLPLPGTGELEAFALTRGPEWKESPSDSKDKDLVGPFQRWYLRMKRLRGSGSPEGEISMDPALREELRALGYVQ